MSEKDSVTDLVVGVIAVMSLGATSEYFSLTDMIIGIILVLFVSQGWPRSKTFYQSLLFSAVFALAALLIAGKALDLLRDNYFDKEISREVTLSGAWLAICLVSFIIDRALQKHSRPRLNARNRTVGNAKDVMLVETSRLVMVLPAVPRSHNREAQDETDQACHNRHDSGRRHYAVSETKKHRNEQVS
jgi:hypothetical protein